MRQSLRSSLALAALAILMGAASAAERPNFLLINCDDLGYADLGCFGSKLHRTPHVDQLAGQGMKLTSFYVTSGVCSPSRASLMTGCYPRRVNLQQDAEGKSVLFPRSKKGLHPDEITIAELLQQQGYATAAIGKWHLGDQPEFLPTRQGFVEYFGIPYSNDMGKYAFPMLNYPELPVLQQEQLLEREPDQKYITRRYTEKAIQFLQSHAAQPFFLYLPHTMPHFPQAASEEFAGKSANGVFGDSVEELDWSTGQILDELDRLKLADRTLIVFMSDNGGQLKHGASNFPLKGGKASCDEGGQRVCCLARWPGHIPAGAVCDELVTAMDWLPTFAALAGAAVPMDRRIDGHDIRPLLFCEPGAKTPYEAFYYYWTSNLEAVRSGDWKLRVANHDAQGHKPFPKPRLYNLKEDIGESQDVAAAHPDVVARLQQLSEAARKDLGDGQTPGANQRPAGLNSHPRAFTDPVP
jgi:arylsulfatase A-like enzyme